MVDSRKVLVKGWQVCPTILIAYSLYHGPSNLMLGELGISVLDPGLCLLFFLNSCLVRTFIKTVYFGFI